MRAIQGTLSLSFLSSVPGAVLDLTNGVYTAKAIICFEQQILLQLRDNIDGIYYPDHWGLFGGEVELGETSEEAVERELAEELLLTSCRATLMFDWKNPETGSVLDFFWVESEIPFASLKLQEGQRMRLFPLSELHYMKVTPDIMINLDKIKNCIERSFTVF